MKLDNLLLETSTKKNDKCNHILCYRYTVSDGVHRVEGKMHVLAAKPDVWIEKAEIVLICGAHFPQTIRNALEENTYIL